jgi:hypothetical protein
MEPKTNGRSPADMVHKQVRDRLRQYPYLAVAAGTGLGFILAGGLAAPKTRRVLGAIGSIALFSPIWSRLITTGLSMIQTPRT